MLDASPLIQPSTLFAPSGKKLVYDDALALRDTGRCVGAREGARPTDGCAPHPAFGHLLPSGEKGV